MFEEINSTHKEGLMEKDDLIQKYIHERLSKTEQEQFDALYANDTEFAKAVVEYENMHAAITSQEKDALKAQLQQLETAEETNHKPSRNYKRLAIAIGLILFFGLISNYFIQRSNSNETLYATYFEPYPNALQPVTRTNDKLDPLVDALYAYEIQEYELAIQKFDGVLKNSSAQKTEILFYKAMSYLNLGNEQKAIEILRSIKHEKTRFAPQIYWYGTLIHVKLNENDKALKALQYMDSQQMTFKNEERKALKNSLK